MSKETGLCVVGGQLWKRGTEKKREEMKQRPAVLYTLVRMQRSDASAGVHYRARIRRHLKIGEHYSSSRTWEQSPA
jgi:hypothetical protein